jgi:hypothetical protein
MSVYIKSIVVDYVGNADAAVARLIMWATRIIPLKLCGLRRYFAGRLQVVPLTPLPGRRLEYTGEVRTVPPEHAWSSPPAFTTIP